MYERNKSKQNITKPKFLWVLLADAVEQFYYLKTDKVKESRIYSIFLM